MTTSKARSQEKVQVHLRLYRADVAAIRREGAREGLPWQTLLRSLVHRAVSDKKGTVK